MLFKLIVCILLIVMSSFFMMFTFEVMWLGIKEFFKIHGEKQTKTNKTEKEQ